MKNEAIEQKEKEKSAELTLVSTTLEESWRDAHNLRKEVHPIKQIAVSK